MTRFARAKGSKSSNEKKPEEATSWAEMKNSMLAKKSVKANEFVPEEKVKIENEPKKTEWASLGDDSFGKSISSIKQHLGKKDNNVDESKKGKKKKKKKLSGDFEEKSNSGEKQENEKKVKKQKISSEVNKEVKSEKKLKKRKSSEPDVKPEEVPPKKKKKLSKNKDGSSETEEKLEKPKTVENKNSQKSQKMQKSKKESKFNGNFNSKTQNKFKMGRKPKNKNFPERNTGIEEIFINGEKVQITKFQGFYVTLEDAERLRNLRNEMIKQGIPKKKMEPAIKLERRRAEKALSRLKKSVCFHCRSHGHLLSNCPKLIEKENTGTGICYKCGSTEHSATECKVVRGTNYQFAECFICKEQGHIARQCPDNPRGLYPQGGACRECGDVTHLRKDCPKVLAQKAEDVVTVGLRSERDLECLDEEIATRENQNTTKKTVKKNSAVKF